MPHRKKIKSAKDYAKDAATAYANLHTWGAVVALLEGGTLIGSNTHAAQRRVIKIAKAEIHKHLVEHDMAIAHVAALTD